tara:strand:- start:10 stop:405 length:396 start_codon:yes stop_codon:yes gene_type:complete
MTKKEITLKNSIKKLFLDRNIEIDKYIIETFCNELKNESSKTLNKLFSRLHDRNYYTDFTKTKARMPYLMELKETLNAVRSDSYITANEFCIKMPKKEKEKKRTFHMEMSKKIKEIVKNGYCERKMDELFA